MLLEELLRATEEKHRVEEERCRAEWKAEEEKCREEQEAREKRRMLEREQQRTREVESAREFADLKSNYQAQRYTDPSPASPLYLMLLTLETGKLLDETQIQWLKRNKLFGPIAIFHEKEFQKSGDM